MITEWKLAVVAAVLVAGVLVVKLFNLAPQWVMQWL